MRVILVFFASFVFATADRNVEDKLRLLEPFLMLTDDLFDKENDDQCLDKLYCLLETEMAEDMDEMNPLKHVSRFLTNSADDTDPEEFHQIEALIKRYPNVSRILDSVRIGQSNRKNNVCSTTFSQCKAEAPEIMTAVRKFSDTTVAAFPSRVKRQLPRTICNILNIVCTGVKFGCGICGIFTFGLCRLACGPTAQSACTIYESSCRGTSVTSWIMI